MLTNPAAVRAFTGLERAARAGGNAWKSEVGRLKVAAKQNAALLPLYEQAAQINGPSAGEVVVDPQRHLTAQH
jgi:hypothetical protein